MHGKLLENATLGIHPGVPDLESMSAMAAGFNGGHLPRVRV